MVYFRLKNNGNKLKILVSNDDGIDSLGIYNLVTALKELGEVTVVAPLKEQSAVGHAITVKEPLRVIKFYKNGGFFGYAVDGTPADCVKMGIKNLMPEPPDIIVSGINHGANTAVNVIYSGTISAAREAAIMDFPSIAISICNFAAENFEFAGKIAKKFTKMVYENGLPKGTLLNINVPDIPESESKGILLTKQGRSKWDEGYEKRKDPYGRDYFWLTGNMVVHDNDLEFDHCAVTNNYVSVTPIHFDLTDHDAYKNMKSWKLND